MARVTAYDGLRGWLLIIIACNHLFGNYVSDFTRSPFGFVSAAEAFVFLSGFVAYLVYSKLDNQPKLQTRRIWLRTFTIYLFHISAIGITFLLVYLFPLYQAMWADFFLAGNFFTDKKQFFLASLMLLEQPGFHDILIMYLFAMLLLPLAMSALRSNLWLIVLLVSIALWLASPYVNLSLIESLYQMLFPQLTPQISYFDPMAWQLYFYLGVLISYAKHSKSITFEFNKTIKLVIFCVALIFMAAKQLGVPDLSNYVANSGTAQLGIVINLLLLAYCFMLWMRHFPRLFTLKYPVFLGQHALPVFAFHTIVVYFLLPATEEYITNYWYWDLVACLVFVGTLAIPAKIDQLYRHRKKNASAFAIKKQALTNAE